MTNESPYARVVEGDRCIVLMTCGHWSHTRRDPSDVIDCEHCGEESRVARDEETDALAFIGSWDYVDA